MDLRRLLLLLKPFDVLSSQQFGGVPPIMSPKVLNYLNSRHVVHRDAVNFCQDILKKKLVDWKTVLRGNLSQPIRDVDLVVTIGGDGTLLQGSHFMDDSIPLLGVNSDPTQAEEVAEYMDEFDATRSTGFLCAATVNNFEQILDDILEGCRVPSELTRMSICVNSQQLHTDALNDVLIAHPCPATVSRFSFRVEQNGQPCSALVNCRSSGLRISTAAGSTAAILSAGGFTMHILSRDLQYLVREPISSGVADSCLMNGLVKFNQTMEIAWFSKEGRIYIDGSHDFYSIQHGDIVKLSATAPILKVFLPDRVL